MSSAILYIAIVAIWAFVLIPRWLRRPHLLGGETDEQVPSTIDGDSPAEPEQSGAEAPDAGQSADADEERHRSAASHRAARPLTRPRMLQARRRLLTMLLGLMAVAGVCTYLKLTSWWACIPPAGMLGVYLLLLREAALADAERARWRVAEDRRVQAARQFAPAERFEPTAQVIDISGRLGDQLYDQYADATIRAVGD
jgi:type IV secretory pathway TrbD component